MFVNNVPNNQPGFEGLFDVFFLLLSWKNDEIQLTFLGGQVGFFCGCLVGLLDRFTVVRLVIGRRVVVVGAGCRDDAVGLTAFTTVVGLLVVVRHFLVVLLAGFLVTIKFVWLSILIFVVFITFFLFSLFFFSTVVFNLEPLAFNITLALCLGVTGLNGGKIIFCRGSVESS